MQFRSSASAHGLATLCFARAVAKYVWGYDQDATPESICKKHKLSEAQFAAAQALFTVFLRQDRPAMEKRAEWVERGWSILLWDDIGLHAKSEEGKRLHTLIQRYLVSGVVPDSRERAAHKCISVLPIKGGSVQQTDIERVVLLDQHTGYQDWMRGSWQGDLKFTVSTEYQRKKDPTTDPQRILYAVDAFDRDSSLVKLKQFWTITEFTGKAALTIKHVWTKDAAYAAYDTYITPLHFKLMQAQKDLLHWNDAEKNQESCGTYPPNGCIMKQHGCRRSLAGRLLAIRPKGKAT